MSSIDNTIDADEVDDFPWEWSGAEPRLASGETLSTADVTILDGNATVDSVSIVGTRVYARLSGASGRLVRAQCRVTTSTGRTLDDTWPLLVRVH